MKIQKLDMTFPGEGDRALIVALDAFGTIVGSITVKRSGPVAEFSRLFVAKDHREKGLGRELVAQAEEVAKVAGCTALSCSVNPKNHVGRHFYALIGFKVVFAFDDGDLLMSRQIVPALVVQSSGGAK